MYDPTRSPTRRSRFTAVAGVGISFAAHLLLLTALSRIGVPQRAPPGDRPIEVELLDAPVRMPDPSPARAPRPGVRRGSAVRPGAAEPLSFPLATATQAPAATGAAPPVYRGGPVETLGADARAQAPAPDLRPRLLPDPEVTPGSRGWMAARPDPAAASSTAALDRWVADVTGRGRVESGLAHPYCSELGRRSRGAGSQRVRSRRGG